MIEPVDRTGGQIGRKHAHMCRLTDSIEQDKSGGAGAAPDGGRAVPWFCKHGDVGPMRRNRIGDLRQVHQGNLGRTVNRGIGQFSGFFA